MKKIVSWCLSIFFILSGLAFLPSISSILFLLAAFMLLPIEKLKTIVDKILPNRKVKIIAIVVIAVVAIAISPTKQAEQPTTTNDTQTYESADAEDNTTNNVGNTNEEEKTLENEETVSNNDDSEQNTLSGKLSNIGAFVENYNKIAKTSIEEIAEIDIQSEEYYRTEFRLNAFKGAPAVKGNLNGNSIEIINSNYDGIFGSDLRIYAFVDNLELATDIFESFCKACDPEITQQDFDDFYKYHKLDSGDCRIVLKQISCYVMVKNNGFDILLDGKPEYFD